MGCIILSALSVGSYRIGWIVSLDRIVSSGLDCIVSYPIVSYRIVSSGSGNIVFMHWLVTAWMGRMVWMVWMDWIGR